jgi:ribosome-associated toxin RatA of RatAB toxin-antitoxin module
MIQLLLCLLFLLSAAPAAAQAPPAKAEPLPATGGAGQNGRLLVDVNRFEVEGQHLYQVQASATVQAAPATVWKVLTAYDRMTEYVPDLGLCRVLARNGNEVIIEQQGNARFLFVTKAVHLIVRALETPMSAIDISLISGNMKRYEARWELVPVPETGGTRVLYSGKMMPDFYVPGMLGATMVRGDIAHMMQAVLARLESERAAVGAAVPVSPAPLPALNTVPASTQAR